MHLANLLDGVQNSQTEDGTRKSTAAQQDNHRIEAALRPRGTLSRIIVPAFAAGPPSPAQLIGDIAPKLASSIYQIGAGVTEGSTRPHSSASTTRPQVADADGASSAGLDRCV